MKYRHKENEFGFSANSVLAAALGIGHEARMFNGKSKVFLKIGIYSTASPLLPSVGYSLSSSGLLPSGGREGLSVNRSGKLPWNCHFMFLQHFEEQ